MKQFIVETSARHVHVSQADLETLFGAGYQLTPNTGTLDLFRETLGFIASFEGEIPGASESKECGNYRELSLDVAKTEAAAYLAVLQGNDNTFEYPN